MDTASKLSRRRVNPVLKIMNYITNVKFNGKEKYSDRKSSAFRRMDNDVGIDLNTKKIINYMDFVHNNKGLIKPKPVYQNLNVKRQRDESDKSMISEYEPSMKKRKIDHRSSMDTAEIKGLDKVRHAIKDDVSMRSVNSILTKQQSNIEMRSYHSKTLEQIQKEILEKKNQNQKMLDEISERNSRRSLMLIDQESKIDYAEKRKILANYYKERSRTTMEELDLINDNYFSKRAKRAKFEQLACTNSSMTIEASKNYAGNIGLKKIENNFAGNNVYNVTNEIGKQASFSDGKQITFGLFKEENKSDNRPKEETNKFENLDTKSTDNGSMKTPNVVEEKKTSLFSDINAGPTSTPFFKASLSTANNTTEGSKLFGSFGSLEKPKEPTASIAKEEVVKTPLLNTTNDIFKIADNKKEEIKPEFKLSTSLTNITPSTSSKSESTIENKEVGSLFTSIEKKTEEKQSEESKLSTPSFLKTGGDIQVKSVEAKPPTSLFGEVKKTESTEKTEIKLSDKPIFGSLKQEVTSNQPISSFKPAESKKEETTETKTEDRQEEPFKKLFGFTGGINTTTSLLTNPNPVFGFNASAPVMTGSKKSEEIKTETKTDNATIKSFIPATTINSTVTETIKTSSTVIPSQSNEKKDDIKNLPTLKLIDTSASSKSLMNDSNPFVNPGKGPNTNIFGKSGSPKKGIIKYINI
jgi:hypothetical protein